MFKYSYRVALNANPEVLRLINNKIHSKNIASQALQLHITVQCSWLQPERAALCSALPEPCQLALSVSWLPQCWWEIELLFPGCFRCADGKSSERKPWPTAGRWEVFAQPSWLCTALAHAPISAAAQLTLGAVLLLLSSCWSRTESPLAGKILTNPLCFGPWCSECAFAQHRRNLQQPAHSHSQVYLHFSLERSPSMGTGPCLEGFQRHVDVAL